MSNLLDELLNIGSTPNWIRPLWAIIQDLSNGPLCRFYIDRYCGWSINDITGLLRRHGVQVWGDIVADDMIIFTVRQPQSRWAEHVLQRAGLPILGISGQKAGNKPSRSRPGKSKANSEWNTLVRWLEDNF